MNNPSDKSPMTISLKWKPLDDIPTLYANQLLISHAGGEFYLFFGEMTPPLALSPADMPDTIEITPKAKIAISPQTMFRFSEAINKNVENYKIKTNPSQFRDNSESSDQKEIKE